MFRVGCMLFAAGALLLSPLVDLLPVDLLGWYYGLFHPEARHVYYRIVPAEPGKVAFDVWLTATGLAFVVLGLFLRRSKCKHP